jgi:hypothetical protein
VAGDGGTRRVRLEFGWFGTLGLRQRFVISRRAASEFPNDNPELHDGIVWSCPEPCAPPLPTLRMRATAGTLPKVLGPAWVVETPADPAPIAVSAPEPAIPAPVAVPAPAPAVPAPVTASVPAPSDAVAPPASPPVAARPPLPGVRNAPALPEGPFERFVGTVARVAMNRGATRAASAVTSLLALGRLAREGLDPALLDGLIRGRILAPGGQVTPEFAAATAAWRAVLEGTGGDLAGCGNSTLDAWAAELLAAVMNAPRAEMAELKRELRRSGVAAFGLLAVA